MTLLWEEASMAEAASQNDPVHLQRATLSLQEGAGSSLEPAWSLQEAAGKLLEAVMNALLPLLFLPLLLQLLTPQKLLGRFSSLKRCQGILCKQPLVLMSGSPDAFVEWNCLS